jgi:hypothetical protein
MKQSIKMKQVLFILIAAFFAACSTSKITQPSNPVPQEVTVFEAAKPIFTTNCDTITGAFTQLMVQVPTKTPNGWVLENFNLYYRLTENEAFNHVPFKYDQDFTVPLLFLATQMKLTVTYRNSETNVFKEVCYQENGGDYLYETKCPTIDRKVRSTKNVQFYVRTPNGKQIPKKQ